MSEAVIELNDVLHRLQGDKELLVELVKIFLDDAPGQFKKAKQLIGDGNFDELVDTAHSVKGAALNVGAEKLARSFREMEEAAKQKDLAEAKKVFKRASVELKELKKYLPQLKAQLAR